MRAAHRLASVVAAGLLAAACLPLALSVSGGSAWAEARAHAQPTPGPGEWWLTGWQVGQRVWPLTEGAGVTVAVLDTGVQASVADLRGVVRPGGDMTGAGRGETDTDAAGDGHGTAVAVLIAGQGLGTGTVGIAPRARILPVTVGRDGPRSAAVTAEAIRFAVGHGAQVIDMSFGTPIVSPGACDPALQAAIAGALRHNVVLVAAAGDANLGRGPGEPGSCAGVLAVAGVEPDGSLWPGSAREPYVAVAAPGDHIVFVGRDGRYSTAATGTSLSSALVAGAAALIRARYPRLPWYAVDQRLTATASPAGQPVPNDGYGSGIVDLARAVNASAYPVPAISAPHLPGLTLEEIVVTGVAAVCVFVAVLVFVLRMSGRRQIGPPGYGRPPGWP